LAVRLNDLEESLRAAQEHIGTLEQDLALYYEQKRAASRGGVQATTGVAGEITQHSQLKGKLSAALQRVAELEAEVQQQHIKAQADTRMAIAQAKKAAADAAARHESELRAERDQRLRAEADRNELQHTMHQLQLEWKEHVRNHQRTLHATQEHAQQQVAAQKQLLLAASQALAQAQQKLALTGRYRCTHWPPTDLLENLTDLCCVLCGVLVVWLWRAVRCGAVRCGAESSWKEDVAARDARSAAAVAELESQLTAQRTAFLNADKALHELQKKWLDLGLEP
jgi:hypothetical protein